MGKFSSDKLSEIISCITSSSRVIVPPTPGCDAGVYKIADEWYMVVSTDPCTGVPQDWFGWLLIQYPSSDVALFGARPILASIDLVGPIGTSYRKYKKIMNQACLAAQELQMDIITGHTGNYPSVSQIIGVCTVTGFTQNTQLITPANSKPEDFILIVKPLGLETVTNFSFTNYGKSKTLFGAKTTQHLRSLIKYQTCVKEALLLAECEGVHALHDTTEGGLVAALNEMAETSRLGFEIFYDDIPIQDEMQQLQEHFNLTTVEVLSTSSTGGLIAAIAPSNKDEITALLTKKGLTHRIIGRFSKKMGRYLSIEKRKQRFPITAKDPYTKIFYTN